MILSSDVKFAKRSNVYLNTPRSCSWFSSVYVPWAPVHHKYFDRRNTKRRKYERCCGILQWGIRNWWKNHQQNHTDYQLDSKSQVRGSRHNVFMGETGSCEAANTLKPKLKVLRRTLRNSTAVNVKRKIVFCFGDVCHELKIKTIGQGSRCFRILKFSL